MSCPARNSKRRYVLTIIVLICIGSISAGYSAIQLWPDLGGQGADLLRNLFGDQWLHRLKQPSFRPRIARIVRPTS